ncbi:transglycosylase domain-containing protein [Aquibacillus sediminis]|uniref:transglycosylase domain-containing protein n=1 Tax=Aquibacillus sediminis TaxID=2574734 RepID=UPI001109A73E|nr:transglycosylase domain-containing protein [Aquibacillus sediminis]
MNIRNQIPSWTVRLKWPIIVVSITILLGIVGYLIILFGGRFVVDEKDLILPATTTIVTKDGTTITELYEENRKLVSIEQIPDHVEDAFVAIEDQRFFSHAGVDFTSVMRAVYRDIIARQKVEGGSTITQQLAKNLFLHNDKTWMRKTKEVMASIYLERNFSKNNILELYLNEIYFAHGVYGVGAAAQFYFNKPVEELTVIEGAMLAALSKAPNTYSPLNNPEKAKQRRDVVLQQMERLDMIETEEMLAMQGKTLGINQPQSSNHPWNDDYIDLVIREAEEKFQLTRSELRRGGYTIVVHLNQEAQRIAYENFQDGSYFYGSTEDVQGSFVLMNQEKAQIEAVLGGRDYQAGNLHRALIPRQPGSTFKPLAVYGPALMHADNYHAYSLLSDEKHSYDGYTVSNVDGSYSGEVTMYDAINQSKNVPAVWLLDQIGVKESKSYLEKMNMPISDNGLAIALGGLEQGVTPVQLVEGYRTFIHGGEWMESSTIDKIYDKDDEVIAAPDVIKQDVFSPQVAWDMVRMLEAVVDSGTASAGEFEQALAGKTGSTQHPQADGQVKDAWFVGVTPEYVTSLWMGYDHSDEDHYLTKGSVAPTVLTKSILSELNKEQPLANKFERPSDVKELPEPIRLPQINDLQAQLKLGGVSLVQGELTWTASEDSRIIYQVYQVTENGDRKIGEVEGVGKFSVDRVKLFSDTNFYVVPYDPVTKQQGKRSNQATLTFDFRSR